MIGRDGTRAEVIEKYEEWLIGARSAPNGELPPDFKQAKKDLEGRRLGCFCYPQPCHGDVLVKFFSGRKSK